MPTVHELIFTVQVSNLHLQFSTEKNNVPNSIDTLP